MKRLEVPVPPNVETASGSTRRVRWHHPRKGVSDIIGNLLIIAITVTLFTALFFFVTSIPAPPAQSTSQFSAQLDIQAGNETGVNITYLTGPILGAGAIQIYLTSQLHPTAFTGCSPAGDPFTIPEGLLGASTWVSGQTWQLSFVKGTAPGDICPSAPTLTASGDNVTISIVNIAQNVLLFRVVLPGSHAIFPPEFISEGVTPSSPVIGNAFTVYAQVAGSYLAPNSVYANLSSLCGTLTPCSYASPKLMTYSTSTGLFQYTVPAGAGIAPIVGSNYPVVINASNRHTLTPILTNSVVFYVSFTSAVLFPQLEVTLSLSQGNPRVDQTVTVTASVVNTHQVGGTGLTVNFSAISHGVSTSLTSVNLPSGIGPAATVTAQTSWTPDHDGSWSIYAQATLTSPSVAGHGELGVTVFPRTLLIDETGVTPGSNGSLDTFTYVATDFSSAGVPFNVTVVPPGTSEITYSGTNPKTSLDMYDVIVWVLSNGVTLVPSDVQSLLCAVEGQRSVWLVGASALGGVNVTNPSITAKCPGPAGFVTMDGPLTTYFGVSTVSNPLSISGELNLSIPSVITVPGFQTVGIDPSNLSLGKVLDGYPSQPHYRYVTPTGTAATIVDAVPTPGTHQDVMVANPTSQGGKTSAASFELATVTQQMPGGSGTYVTSLAQQASLVYDTFNWLANFTSTTRQGNDWAVSQVVTQPSQLSFDRPVAINFTVRNNGPGTGPVVATLYVDGFPIYYDGALVTNTTTPGPFGNESNGTVYWTPDFVGFLTLGIQITTPLSDTDLANNFMANSLFAEQLYVHFSVLVVDATGKKAPDTTPILDQALNATGFPPGTITYVHLPASCSPLPDAIGVNVASGAYNMIIWNAGENVNGSTGGRTCALSAPNALNLTTFLNTGGGRASLLFVGNGLLTEFQKGNAQAEAFAEEYLGLDPTPTSITSVTPGTNLYGAIGDNIGNGVDLGLNPGSTNLTFPKSELTSPGSGNIVPSAAFYFDSTDFWTTPTGDVAAVDSYSPVAGWHTAWWGFDVASVSDRQILNLVMLRTATDLGRILPNSDTVVGPPDITFATAQVPYMNFDEMHPQIDEQSLIRVNLTNLGGAPAYGIGVSILDGQHILDVQTMTIGGSSPLSSNQIQLGVASLSLAWTPLYAGVNPIVVEITTSTAGQILPGVANAAEGNVTVYFFYDNTTNNANQWTHNNVILWQDPEDPGFNSGIHWVDWGGGTPCSTPTDGYQPYYFGDTNMPVEWPLAPPGLKPRSGLSGSFYYQYSSCASVYPNNSTGVTVEINGYVPQFAGTAQAPKAPSCPDNNLYQTWYTDAYGNSFNVCTGVWGIDTEGPPSSQYNTTSLSPFAPCYVAGNLCASLAVLDNAFTPGYYTWTQSSPVTIPTYAASATASWWQKYSLDPSVTGGIVCVEPVTVTSLSLSGTSFCTPPTTGAPIVNPLPGYTGSIEYKSGGQCKVIDSFTGASGGGTFSWTQAKMNLSQYAGQTVRLWFGYIESSSGCGASLGGYNGGWWINQLQIQDSLPDAGLPNSWSSAAISESPTTCNTQSGPHDVTTNQGNYIPPDLWHLQPVAGGAWYAQHGLTSPTFQTSSVWMAGIPTANSMELDPNMWDALISRPIDLSDAATAQITFHWLWQWNSLTGTPPMAFTLLVTPVNPSGQTNYIQIWNADLNATTGALQPSSNVWQSTTIPLSGYDGDVIQLQFLVSTNCDATYPYQPGGALLSDIQVSGTTIVSAGAARTAFRSPSQTSSPGMSVSAPGSLTSRTIIFVGNFTTNSVSIVAAVAALTPGLLMVARWLPPRTSKTAHGRLRIHLEKWVGRTGERLTR